MPPVIRDQARRAAMLLCIALRAFGASPDSSAAGGTATLKSDVSRAAVTKMPVFTVEESKSEKTHTLFMGADISINLDKDLYGVKDVFGSNWVIEINGREKEISARRAPLDLKITPSLKLTEASVTIQGFKRVQAYSFANDPSVRLTRGLTQAGSINSDLLAMSGNAQHIADTMASHNSGPFAGADDQFSANALMNTAEYAFANQHGQRGGGPTATEGSTEVLPDSPGQSPFSSPADIGRAQFINPTAQANNAVSAQTAASSRLQTTNGDEPAGKIASSGLDAMDVEFDIRSSKVLQNPYVVTMTRFRTPTGKPGMVQNMVYAQSLHPIDEHLSHVHFVEEGFPFGYELLDFQLHIYDRGVEIASNIAANRVELTREEAFEYVKMEYIGSHLKDTLPAVPAMGKLPADLPSILATGKYAWPFYVRVSPDGLADKAFSDAACTREVGDAFLDSVVGRIRFKPALDHGKPVDGVASLNLSKLAI
jgi:hypothetical protein